MTDLPAINKCDRCGQTRAIELHHIKYQVYGGTNDKENLVPLCMGCHDYRHAKEAVLRAIASEEKRIIVLKRRLELIEEHNTPAQILERGYQSYFDSYKEILPPRRSCATGGVIPRTEVKTEEIK